MFGISKKETKKENALTIADDDNAVILKPDGQIIVKLAWAQCREESSARVRLMATVAISKLLTQNQEGLSGLIRDCIDRYQQESCTDGEALEYGAGRA